MSRFSRAAAREKRPIKKTAPESEISRTVFQTPSPGGGECYIMSFLGGRTPQKRHNSLPPSQREGRSGGMGLPANPTKTLC